MSLLFFLRLNHSKKIIAMRETIKADLLNEIARSKIVIINITVLNVFFLMQKTNGIQQSK